MNPSWAQGFQRANGRAPSQGDWESFINRQRNGGVEEPTTASQVGQFAGPVGTVAGMYAASQLPSLFGAGAATGATAGAGATGAGIAGTAATTGATAAGTTAATGASAAGAGTGIYGSLSAAAPVALPALAAAATAYGIYDTAKKWNNMSQSEGVLRMALLTGGLGAPLGLFAHKPQTKVEESRWRDLGDQGFGVPDWVANGTDINAKGAGARRDLAADFIGLAPTAGEAVGFGASPAGSWVNNKFAESRDVADLTAKDIWGYAALPELFGKDYVTTSEANREAIAAKALELGLVSEGKGTIDIKDDPALREYWTSLTTPKSDNQQVADTVKDTVRRLYNK